MSIDKFPYYFAAILIASAAIAFVSIPVAVLIFTLSTGIIMIRQYLQIHALIKEEITTSWTDIAYVIGFISIIFIIVGYLFRIMHWPFAGPLFILATAGVIITAIFTAIAYLSARSIKHNPLPYLLLLIPFMVVFCTTLIRAGSDDKRIATINRIIIQDELAQIQASKQSKLNTLIFASVPDSINDSLSIIHNESMELRKYMHSLRDKLIEVTGGREEDGEYKGKMEATAVIVYLIGTEGAHNGEAYELEEKLKAFYALCGKRFEISHSPKGIQAIDRYFPYPITMGEAMLTISHLELSALQVEEEYLLEHLKNQDSQSR